MGAGVERSAASVERLSHRGIPAAYHLTTYLPIGDCTVHAVRLIAGNLPWT